MTTGFHYKDGVLHCEGIALSEIAKQYDTPCYVYSANQLASNVKTLTDELDLKLKQRPHIAYAVKANSNIAVLKELASHGLGADVVSAGELRRAMIAGISAEKCVFSGVGKSTKELEYAIKHGIMQINVESKAELHHIAALCEKADTSVNVAFRFNPDVAADTHEKIATGKSENKFGLTADTIHELYSFSEDHQHLTPKGVSVHIGSQLLDIAPYKAAFSKLRDLVTNLREDGHDIATIDLGGGLGVVYNNEKPVDLGGYAQIIADIIEPLGSKIILEPGRFIAANAGILLSRVTYIKHEYDKHFVILNTGMNDFLRPALYDGYHAACHVNEDNSRKMVTYDIVGPICESSDVFHKNTNMQETKTGDLIALMNCGAYGFVMASNYNTNPLTAEVFVKSGKHDLIRQRQTFDDIIKDETIPDWL